MALHYSECFGCFKVKIHVFVFKSIFLRFCVYEFTNRELIFLISKSQIFL